MSWLDDVIAVYGEPKVKPPTPEGVALEGDEGRYQRCAWVWFPAASNHCISIDTYPRRWRGFVDESGTYNYYVVRVGSHRKEVGHIEWRGRTEPDDDSMRKLLDVTGFLTTVAAVV